MIKLKKKVYFFPLLLISLLFFLKPAFVLAQEYQAEKISQSHAGIIELKSGENSVFWVKFKNTGNSSWSGMGPQAVTLRTVSGMPGKLKDSSWYQDYIPNRVNPVSNIYPGEEALFRFNIKAPSSTGLHWEKLQLYAGSNPISGGGIEIAVQASATAITPSPVSPVDSEPETVPTPVPESLPQEPETQWWQTISSDINIATNIRWPNSPQGPIIKVGLFYVDVEEKNDYLPLDISTLNQQLYDIYDQNNRLLIRNTAGESVKIDYDYENNYYFVNDASGKRLLMTDSYLVLKSNNPVIFKINSWHNGPFWGQNVNDNEFRGDLKIHYNPNTKRLWIINQLPLEEYVKGVVEVGDSSPFEFLKAQMIAARTYALFRMIAPKYTNTPDGQNFFTVRATQADQVYRGYQGELRTPRANQAAEATQSIVATYQQDPIVAYYFAQSDGYTRDSHVVYMTAQPVDYLKGKFDPPGQGKTMLGHGVGLPQISGMTAANQGANYGQILKYYYTGISLTKMY